MLGFLVINKPRGPTSHDMVYRVRKMLPRGTRVGHAGTLDPFATGILLVCVGGACRLASLVMGQDKVYVTTIQLGAGSDTDDLTGQITPTPGATAPEAGRIAEVLATFTGDLLQIPPAHSAALVDGQRAYKLARNGEQPVLKAKPVTVNSIKLLAYEYPQLKIEISCGSGTYIRSLARDIGQALGTGGYCTQLERTASGAFTMEQAAGPVDVDVHRDLISPLIAVEHLPKLNLTQEQVKNILLGRRIVNAAPIHEGEVALVDAEGKLFALGLMSAIGTVQPTKVLINTHALSGGKG